MELTIDYNIKPSFKTVLTSKQLDVIRPLKDFDYNGQIVDQLVKTFAYSGIKLNDEQKDNLGTYVYLARQQFRQEEQSKLTDNLKKQGWNILSRETANNLNGKKIKLLAKQDIDWFTNKIEQDMKIFIEPETTTIWLMKPRARTRGIALSSLENPMYKLI